MQCPGHWPGLDRGRRERASLRDGRDRLWQQRLGVGRQRDRDELQVPRPARPQPRPARPTATGDNATATGQSANATGTTASAFGQGSVANGDATTAIGQASSASATGATAIGQGASASASNSVAIGTGSVANVANTVSVGAAGSERQIVNVAAGTLAGSTDAVNGSQLLTANQRVAAAFGGGAGLDLNGQLTAPSYTIQGTIYSDVGSAFSAVNTQLSAISGSSTYYKANSTGPAAQATGSNALAMGSNAQGSGADAIAIGSNALATQSGSIALGKRGVDRRQRRRHRHRCRSPPALIAVGNGASAANGGAAFGDFATATGGVANVSSATAIGNSASATTANAVAVGQKRDGAGDERLRRLRRQCGHAGHLRPIRSRSGKARWRAPPTPCRSGRAGSERRLTNVAAGIYGDRCRQCRAVHSSMAYQASAQINDNNREARAGTAVALAVGGTANSLPGRKFALSASHGNFQGSNALGIGATALLYDTRSYAIVVNAGARGSAWTPMWSARAEPSRCSGE